MTPSFSFTRLEGTLLPLTWRCPLALKLYNHPMSPNGRKIAALAIELGLNLEIETVDLMNGAHKDSAYLAMNPNGKVPLLDEDGWHLWESAAIMQYLADCR